MPLAKKGLRVKWCENVARFSDPDENKGHCRLVKTWPDGWYIQVRFTSKWHSLTDLRFARERDALRAAQTLTAAGLDSYGALSKAEPLMVKQLACENLEW